MPDIDNLQIKVNAESSKATDGITKLTRALVNLGDATGRISNGKLLSLANGMRDFSSASTTLSNIKTTDINRLVKNLNNLSEVNAGGIRQTSNAITSMAYAFSEIKAGGEGAAQLTSLYQSISRLGSAKIDKAITNIPALTSALNSMITTLAKAPEVSNNTIALTNAISNLASQGSKVTSATKAINKSFSDTNEAMKKSNTSTVSLASSIGKLYAAYFWVKTAISGFGKAINSASDYIEQFNYFNVTTQKIASEWSKDWEKYGYDNAESYASSFSDRIKSTLGKMTGFQMNSNGTLSEISSMQNLGLNPTTLVNYSSGLMQVTNSLGLTGEASVNTSKALTMLAGDMSSFRNVDLSTVMTNFQSGIIGQSRALYKYGIDITNATLQTYAYKYGIEKSVTEMTQAEKMQLRLLAILDQSKVAYGDLANTIQSPANQLRLFENNLANLSRTFGNVFLPTVAKVLPYINGFVIAIRRLVEWVGNLAGVDLSSTVQNSSVGYSNAADDVDDYTDAVTDATQASKAFQNQVLGFDQINKLSDSSSGALSKALGVGNTIDLTKDISGAVSDYESTWTKAFSNMENKANGFADAITRYLSPLSNLVTVMTSFAKGFGRGLWTGFVDTVSMLGKGIILFGGIVGDVLDLIPDRVLEAAGAGLGSFLGAILAFAAVNKVVKTIKSLSVIPTLIGLIGASPIVAVSAGVLGLASAIVALSTPNEFKPLVTMSDAVRKLHDETVSLNEEIDNLQKERSSTFEDSAVETAYIQNLSDKYFDLKNKQSLSNDEVKLMKSYYDELAKQLPGFQSIVDSQTTSYDNQRTSVQGLIDDLKKKAMVEAAHDVMVDIAKDKLKVQKQLNDYLEKEGTNIEEITKKREALRIEYQNGKAEIEKYQKMLYEVETADNMDSDAKTRKIVEITNKLNDLDKLYGLHKTTLGTVTKAYLQINDDYGAVIKDCNDLKGQLVDLGNEWDFYGNVAAGVTDATTGYTTNMKNSAADMATGVSGSADTTKIAINGVNDAMGNVSSQSSNMKDSVLRNMNLIGSGIGSIKDTINASLSNLFAQGNYETYGKQVLEGFKKGLKNPSLLFDVGNAAAGIGKISQLGLTGQLIIQSPSKVFESYGMYTVKGYNKGILKNADSTKKAIDYWASSIPTYEVKTNFANAGMPDMLSGGSMALNATVTGGALDILSAKIDSLIAKDTNVTANVNLVGDAKGIFKQVQTEANAYAKQNRMTPFPT